MSDLYYDPDTGDAARFEQACERYDESDQFPVNAWDWMSALPVPPAWLIPQLEHRNPGNYGAEWEAFCDESTCPAWAIGLVEYHYRGTLDYVLDVDNWADNEATP
jgi:hypothetical protein